MDIVTLEAPTRQLLAPVIEPTLAFRWGAEDGKASLPCCPELYFQRHDDLVDYARGHQSTAGKTLLSCQTLKNGPVPIPVDLDVVYVARGLDFDAELADLQSAMADESFWAQGC